MTVGRRFVKLFSRSRVEEDIRAEIETHIAAVSASRPTVAITTGMPKTTKAMAASCGLAHISPRA